MSIRNFILPALAGIAISASGVLDGMNVGQMALFYFGIYSIAITVRNSR